MWVKQDQTAYFYNAQTLDETESLPSIIEDKFKHLHYTNPLELYVTCFDTIIFDDHNIVEQS